MTFADALTLCQKLGVGRPGSQPWGEAQDIHDTVVWNQDLPKDDPKRVPLDRTFTGRSFINAAKGLTLPHKKTYSRIRTFLTHGEKCCSEWQLFLDNAYEYSKTIGKSGQKRDDKKTGLLFSLCGKPLSEAIRFAAGSGLSDYRDIHLVPDSSPEARRLVLDCPITLSLLKADLFMPRPRVEHAASEALRSFLFIQTAAKAPTVFWLDGRSGDGKSALLFRLPFTITGMTHHFIHLERREALQELDVFNHALLGKRLVLVVDDLAKLLVERNRNDVLRAKFKEYELAVSKGHLRSITLLTCGPTPEMEHFRDSYHEIATVNYTIPRLDENERRAFAEWFGYKKAGAHGQNSDHLVEYLFVIRHGMSLRQFAASFRERLTGIFDSFEPVYRVMVGTSFELPTPLSFVETHRQKTALDQLAKPDQAHFWYDDGAQFKGVYFSHNAIGKAILREWMSDPSYPTQLEKLAAALADFLSPCTDERYAFRVTERLRLHPHHANDICGDDVPVAELLRFTQNGLAPGSVGWLSIGSAFASEVAMKQDASLAKVCLEGFDFAAAFQPSHGDTASIYLAKMAELTLLASETKYESIREQCVDAIFGKALGPAAGYAVGHLVARKVLPDESIEKWMVLNPEAPRPPELICASAFSPLTLNEAKKWLAKNGASQQSIKVATWLIAHSTNIDEALERIEAWLRANISLNGQYSVLGQLLSHFPITNDLRNLALDWIAANQLTPGAGDTLAQLVRNEPYSPEIGQAAIAYFRSCKDEFGGTAALRDRLGPVIESALKSWARRLTLLWLCSTGFIRAFPESDQANKLFGALNKWPKARWDRYDRRELNELSELLFDAGIDQPFAASHLPVHLRFLRGDQRRLERAYTWLATSPHRSRGHNVAVALMEIAPNAEKIWRWIDEFRLIKGIEGVVIKYFQRFHMENYKRARMFAWLEENSDRATGQQFRRYVERHYPQYVDEIGTSRSGGNAPSLHYNFIEQARERFQSNPNLANARAVERLVISNLDAKSAIGAVSALLKEECEGFDPLPLAEAVIRHNFGKAIAITVVTRVVNGFELDPDFAQEIQTWVRLHKDAKAIGVPLLACLDKGVLDVETDCEWIIDKLLARHEVFANQTRRIVSHVAKSARVLGIETATFKRFVSIPNIFNHDDLYRLLARRIAKEPGLSWDLLGAPTSPVAGTLWRIVFQWDNAPADVQIAFYSWCNELTRIGLEYHVANVVQDLPIPPWLDILEIDLPARCLIKY